MQYRREFSGLGGRGFNVALCAAFAGAAALGTLSLSREASAQAFPFPSAKPTMGFTTSVLTSHELRAQYNLWKERFVQRCGQGDARVRYPESGDDTRSEGVGYGMVIAAYMGDQETFDGLWDYYQRSSPGDTGLMHWRRNGCDAGGGGGDTGSASDADIDAAFGLIVANKQWPNQGYAADASRIVGAIRTRLFQGGCNGILLAGTQFANCGCINPSYIPPGYYPAFGAAEGQAQFWDTARNASYTYFNAVNDNNTGLVPAWSQANGSLQLAGGCTPQVSGGGQPNEFQADAARTPWRVAMDYLWTANASARGFLQLMANFATDQRIVQIVDRYNLNGNPLNGNGQGQNLDATGFRSTFTMGGFATAMTASSQEDLDAFTGAWQSMYLPGDNIGANNSVAPRAFNSSLALLYGLTVTGFLWDPTGANPARVTEPALNAQPGNQLENGDFDEGFLGWSFANLDDPGTPGLRAEGFAMHKAGELEVRLQRAAAREEDPWEVRLSQGVSVQAGTNYLISVRARASAPRPFRISIQTGDGQPYELYGALGNRVEDAPVTLGTEMQTYEWVFTSTGTNQNARFDVDVANSDVTLVVDDVFFGTTDRPPSVTGELAGQPPPNGTPVDGAPVGTPPGGGTTPPGGNLGPVGSGNGGDVGSVPGSTPPPGGAPIDVNGGLPPIPSGRPPGNGSCRTDADCGPDYQCSEAIQLCYEDTYGYVWDASANMGQGGWSQPPRYFDYDGDGIIDDDCGPEFVYWPKMNGCYDPESGYAFNPSTNEWQYIGDQYTFGRDNPGAPDSGCAVGSGPGSERAPLWVLAGVLGAGFAGAARRRRAGRK